MGLIIDLSFLTEGFRFWLSENRGFRKIFGGLNNEN
jgi:hypothetical protein